MSLELECPKREELEAFVLGKIADANAADIKSHVAECDSCRTVCDSLSFDTMATPAKFSSIEPDPTLPIRKAVPKEDDFSYLLPPVEPGEMGRLGNYRVLHVLGQGGMGVVFRAEDISLHRPVALKVMRPEMHGNREGWERFLREARVMAQIKHDNLVTIYNAGQEGNVVYFAMELLEGESLDAWRKHGSTTDIAEIVRMALQIAKGLAFIHRKGLIHRDIKPANIWLEKPENRIKILNLGLVLPMEADAKLTATGTVMGTPDFMSPEQARGDPVDARSDLFSLGGVLYYLCTGRKPFAGHTTSAVLMALASETPPSASSLNPQIPEPLSELVMQMLSRDPNKRPASADEVIYRLETIDDVQIRQVSPTVPVKTTTAPPTREPLPAWAKGAIVFAAVAVVSGAAFWGIKAFLTPPAPPNPPPGKIAANPPIEPVAKTPVDPPKKTPAETPKKMPIDPPAKTPIDPPVKPPIPSKKFYLTDMQPVFKSYWPFKQGPDDQKKEKKKGPKDNKDKDKQPDKEPKEVDMTVRFQGMIAPHGIFMHPPAPPNTGQPASLTYNVLSQFRNFSAQVSLNDGYTCKVAPCVFKVHGDEKLLWQSQPIWSHTDVQTVDISVQRVEQLKISVTCAGEPYGAHAIWVEPFLTK